MLSLKPFLHRDEPHREDLAAAYRHMIASLLDGIVAHAVRGDPVDYARLECDMASLRREVSSEEFSSADLLISTGTALKAIQDYNRRTGAFMQAQAAEIQKITGMLTQAIINLAAEGSTNVSRLQSLEKQLETAAGVDNVRVLKEKLSECLTGIREEKLRQKAASEMAVSKLKENLQSTGSVGLGSLAGAESEAGMRTRPAAENGIARASDGAQTSYAALFVIDHLHGLNARFGRAIGDQIISVFVQHLSQHLLPQDTTYRWSGPAFLVIAQRDEGLDKVRRELARVATARLELNVEARGRAVLLPIHVSWTLQTIPLCGKAGAVIDHLDAFLASKVGT